MTREQFHILVITTRRPVILVEGTRRLPESDADKLVVFARHLAGEYPHAVFRTGNAKGSDEAFARGVTAVDPERLQYILPYSGHRKRAVHRASYQFALTELTSFAEERVAYQTTQSSPEYASMLQRRNTVPQLRSKARYLLRDTVKVIGNRESGLAPATLGIFYVNAGDPLGGGTGHTIRVCRQHDVPAVFQDDWLHWPATTSRT